MTAKLSARDLEVLDDLFDQRARWSRPMDVGGTDASHHSATLMKLVRLGLVEREKRHTLMNVISRRGVSFLYRITVAGRQALGKATEDTPA